MVSFYAAITVSTGNNLKFFVASSNIMYTAAAPLMNITFT